MSIVGRETELTALSRAVEALVGGGSPQVEIAGPRGAGRSTLLGSAVREARRAGAVVLSAFGDADTAHGDHGIITQLMGSLGPRAAVSASTAALLGLTRTAPVLVAVDDADQLGQSSRAWLASLSGRADRAGLMVAVVSDGVHTTLDDAELLAPRSLGIGPVTELVATTFGTRPEPEFAAEVERCTGGLPVLLSGVLDRCVAEGLTPTARDAARLPELATEVAGDRVARIVRTLPAEVAALARALAVCGPGFDFTQVCALARLRYWSPAAALGLLAGTGLVVAGEQPRLAPGTAPARVLEGMPPSARWDLHMRAARLGYRCAVDELELARILASAPPLGAPWVVPLLRVAARRAAGGGDPCLAVRHLERVLRERLDPVTRAEVVLELALNENSRAPEIADRRLARMLAEPLPPECAVVRRAAADQLFARGDAALIRRTFGALPESAPERDAASALYWTTDDALVLPPEQRLLEVPELVLAPDPPSRSAPAALICAMRGEDAELTKVLARTALGDPSSMLMSRLIAGFALVLADELTEAETALDGALFEARTRGLTAVAGRVLLARAGIRVAQARLDDAAADLDRAVSELPRANWHPDLRPLLDTSVVLVSLARGEIDRAREAAHRVSDDEIGRGYAGIWFLFARGVLASACGNAAAAVVDLEQCGARMRARKSLNAMVLSWRSEAAAAWRALGDTDRAAVLATEEMAFARRWGTPGVLARAHLNCARVGAAEEHQREAVRLLQDSPHRLLRARALLDLAETLGPRGGAALVREAGVIAATGRAVPLVARARDLGWVSGD